MNNSEPHQIVDHYIPLSLTGEENFCPVCRVNWKTKPIPERHQHFYGGATHFSDLAGIEIPGFYDGIAYWECQFCKTHFPRVGISELNGDLELVRIRS
jgi:hypothetical protein